MEIQKTPLKDCFVLKPTVIEDNRGYFFERYNKTTLRELTGFSIDFVQDNVSFSQYGVIRGLHAQKGPSSQTKIISVNQGKVLDAVVDVRQNSKTFGQVFQTQLSAGNKKQVLVPRGFLHGFAVLSKSVMFTYKCDNYYDKSAEIGVRYDDPDLNIDWKIPRKDRILSKKDLQLPSFKSFQANA